MITFSQDNLNIYISILSLIVSCIALIRNRKKTLNNSYNQQASYCVFLVKTNGLDKLKKAYDFTVKTSSSISSEEIPFEYSLFIRSYIGGISRTQLFEVLDQNSFRGINRTIPTILPNRPPFFIPKREANKQEFYLSTSPLYPYFSISHENNKKLNRYHFYIEITDYCNYTQIWYMSFSLLLSNSTESNSVWKQCDKNFPYKYYTFDDINIVSPKDIPKNYDRAESFHESLNDIRENAQKALNSNIISTNDFDVIKYDLQLYEMREYIFFLKDLYINKII